MVARTHNTELDLRKDNQNNNADKEIKEDHPMLGKAVETEGAKVGNKPTNLLLQPCEARTIIFQATHAKNVDS